MHAKLVILLLITTSAMAAAQHMSFNGDWLGNQVMSRPEPSNDETMLGIDMPSSRPQSAARSAPVVRRRGAFTPVLRGAAAPACPFCLTSVPGATAEPT